MFFTALALVTGGVLVGAPSPSLPAASIHFSAADPSPTARMALVDESPWEVEELTFAFFAGPGNCTNGFDVDCYELKLLLVSIDAQVRIGLYWQEVMSIIAAAEASMVGRDAAQRALIIAGANADIATAWSTHHHFLYLMHLQFQQDVQACCNEPGDPYNDGYEPTELGFGPMVPVIASPCEVLASFDDNVANCLAEARGLYELEFSNSYTLLIYDLVRAINPHDQTMAHAMHGSRIAAARATYEDRMEDCCVGLWPFTGE